MDLEHFLADQQKYSDELLAWKSNSITNIGKTDNPNIIAILFNWIIWLSKTKTVKNAKQSFFYVFQFASTLFTNIPIVVVLFFLAGVWFKVLQIEYKSKDNQNRIDSFWLFVARRSFIPFILLLLLPYLLFITMSMGSDFISNMTTYLTETRGMMLLDQKIQDITQTSIDRAIYNICSDLRENLRSVTGMREGRTALEIEKAVLNLAGPT